jgi:hypothetical protein
LFSSLSLPPRQGILLPDEDEESALWHKRRFPNPWEWRSQLKASAMSDRTRDVVDPKECVITLCRPYTMLSSPVPFGGRIWSRRP